MIRIRLRMLLFTALLAALSPVSFAQTTDGDWKALSTEAESLYQAEEYERALPIAQAALAAAEKSTAPNSMDVASCLTTLADIHFAMSDYNMAEPIYLRALSLHEVNPGQDAAGVSNILSNLGEIHFTREEFVTATPFLERALSINEEIYGPEHAYVAVNLNNLANALSEQRGRYTEAESDYLRAIDIYVKTLGANHPNVGVSLLGLGALYVKQRKYSKAEPLLLSALGILEKSFGPSDPRVVSAQSHLVSLQNQRNTYRNRNRDSYEMAAPQPGNY